tara:strand:- start:2176 stop:3087 length:912 start_codon:yes stop_codon:yes gene_type:complete
MHKYSLGFIGLGKMGLPIVKIFLKKGISIFAYDIDKSKIKIVEKLGANPIESINHFSKIKVSTKIIWLMVPLGTTVDEVIDKLIPGLKKGDIIIDGGNASYKDSIRRKRKLSKYKIGFVGVGTSGGIKGAMNGPPMTIDCSIENYNKICPFLEILGGNYSFFEEGGKGHLAKTIHNAIEYGMMQSLAEGILLYFKHGFTEEEIKKIFVTWSKGSIIESKLIGCINEIMSKNSLLDSHQIKKSETIKIVEEILMDNCYTPILKKSMSLRKETLKQDEIVNTVLARLRLFFGGHELEKKNNKILK